MDREFRPPEKSGKAYLYTLSWLCYRHTTATGWKTYVVGDRTRRDAASGILKEWKVEE